MNDYTALRIDLSPCDSDTTDLLAGYLADVGYESFEPDDTGLTAYIPAESFSEQEVRDVLEDFPMQVEPTVSHTLVAGQDWNSEWEKNYFRPIVIGDECVIHSTFHTDISHARYDIVIDPKMAFGTGHHATTSMMLRHILNSDIEGRQVIDMGTGTGILAILAKMKGAAEVTGIEIDPAACANAAENVALNNVEVRLLEGDSSRLADIGGADLFLANINRNVILADLSRYAEALKPDGEMILSGFYASDIPLIERAAEIYGLRPIGILTMPDPNLTEDDPARKHGDWASVRLHKES